MSEIDLDFIERMMLSLARAKTGPRMTNILVQAIRVPLGYWSRANRRPNALSGLEKLDEKTKRRGILDIDEIRTIVTMGPLMRPIGHTKTLHEDKDPRPRAAVLLGLLCGLRAGECRGLRWSDIDEKSMILNIQHNFTDADGNKAPKWDSCRQVPLPDVVLASLRACHSLSPRTDPKYILWNIRNPDTPMSIHAIATGFKNTCAAIGIDDETMKARALCFHSTRHSFVSMSLSSGVSPHMVELIAGHTEGGKMQKRYTHGSIIDFKQARVSIENALVTNF